jgi:nucleoside-diphosphate-sugar epimerase
MAKTAFIIGGTGQIGRAASRRLLEAGWDVTVASRGERSLPDDLARDVRHAELDRNDDAALRAALAGGADVLVDVIAFEPKDAQQLLSLSDLAGSLIVISTGSVYTDAGGQTLDEASNESEFPELPVPIPESQTTVAPGEATYSTKKAAIEQLLLEQDELPATVIRPFAIHGPGAAGSREWHFVKRILDRRQFALLVDRGESRFQTTSVANLAELIALAAGRPRTAVFNCGDPDTPTVLEIERAIAGALDYSWTEVLFDRAEPWQRGHDAPGDSPWSALKPIVADMTAAEIEFGYRPRVTYAEAVKATCDWLVSATNGRDWREVLPASAAREEESFDYDAEDAFIRGLTGG